MKSQEPKVRIDDFGQRRKLEFLHHERERIQRQIGQAEAKASGLLIASILLCISGTIAFGLLRFSQPGPEVNVIGSGLFGVLAFISSISGATQLRALGTRENVEHSVESALLLHHPEGHEAASYEEPIRICEAMVKSSLHELKEKSSWADSGKTFMTGGLTLLLFQILLYAFSPLVTRAFLT